MAEVKLSSCLLMDADKLLLIRPKDSQCWTLPGGPIDDSLGDEQSALSHTEKKTGLKARVIQLFGIYEYQDDSDNFEAHVFESDLPSAAERDVDPQEDVEAKWFKLSDAKKAKVCDQLKLVFEEL